MFCAVLRSKLSDQFTDKHKTHILKEIISKFTLKQFYVQNNIQIIALVSITQTNFTFHRN